MLNLITTKFHRPALPPRRVERAWLLDRLNEGLALGRPLTLVSAPAGFGKTTCVSEWLEHLDFPVAWLSLDSADDEPARFYDLLTAALRKIEPKVGQEIEAVLRSGQAPGPETMAALLLDDLLQIKTRFLFILDDFQAIQDPAIMAMLEKLLAVHPPQLHLVLTTREDPPLPLARWRASNLMTEIRAADLKFSEAEAELFFRQAMGITLTHPDLAALQERTEGWVVGLQLAGLSLRDRQDSSAFIAGLSGSHRYILGYLTEEVLNRQPIEIQDFLLQTSILERLNGDLCAAVTGRSDSFDLLEKCLQANLFIIPLDDEQRWYRYHHLFRELLQNLFQRRYKDRLEELHQRASAWYEHAGMIGEAGHHALAGRDYAHAVRLLEEHAMLLMTQGRARLLEEWMRAIPTEWHTHSPRAKLAFAWLHLLRGNYNQVDPYLRQAEAAIASTDSPNDALRAEWAALKANLLHIQGITAESLTLAERALKLSHPDDHWIRGLAYLGKGGAYRQAGDYASSKQAYLSAIQYSRLASNRVAEMLAVSALALMSIQHGHLRFAVEIGLDGIEHMEREGAILPIAGSVYGALGLVHYEWNRFEEARRFLERGIHLSGLSGHSAALIYIHVTLARLAQAEGDMPKAEEYLASAAELLQRGAPIWLKPEVTAGHVQLYLAQDRADEADAALERQGISLQLVSLPKEMTHPGEIYYLAALRLILHRARKRLLSEELHTGFELADRLISGALKGERSGMALQAYLLRAQMHAAQGNQRAALADLSSALALGKEEGYIRSFVDEGVPLADLLRLYLDNNGEQDYALTLLGAFPPVEAPALKPQAAVEAVEPLSGRELEVLLLMAQGMKYEEIADKLFVSVNTVRFHIKKIYAKLQVNNRTQAIETGRKLNLIKE